MKKVEKNSKMKGAGRKALDAVRGDYMKMVNEIMTNPLAAKDFFYVEMRPKAESISKSFAAKSGGSYDVDYICTIIYTSCWENDWAKLRAFKGNMSPHGWVARIGLQSTIDRLVEELYMDGVTFGKISDYRLTIKGISDKDHRQAIIDLVEDSKMHHVLELKYVAKMPDEKIAKEFGGDDKAKAVITEAEAHLISQLFLHSDNPYYSRGFSPKRPINLETPLQIWHDRIEESESENKLHLREVMTTISGDEDWDNNVRRFVSEIIDKAQWTLCDKEIMRSRFLYNAPAAELAEDLGLTVPGINSRYANLKKRFRIEARRWWSEVS